MTPDLAAELPLRRSHWASHLYLQVLVAIALGALLGAVRPEWGAAMKPLGDAFIKLVKMVIAPVIFLTLATGIAGVAELRGLGRVAGKALGYFFVVSTFALVVGLIVGSLVRPGAGLGVDVAALDQTAVQGYVQQAHETVVGQFEIFL